MKHIPNVFLKPATLTLFILLITGFVAYRAGVLPAGAATGIQEETPPGGTMTYATAPDTLPPIEVDSPPVEPYIMSSSKSMLITDRESLSKKPLPDSVLNKEEKELYRARQFLRNGVPDSVLKQDRIMSSSKSGVIFSGSKSGPVFTTDLDTANQPAEGKKPATKKNHKE